MRDFQNVPTPNGVPRILLVGVGRWGENHLRAWLKLQAEGMCQLVGVQDTDEERLTQIARDFGIRTYADDSALAGADAVDIAVPTYSHHEIASRALAAGKDVLVEKPLTQSLEEARDLERRHRETNQIVMVGHLFRYNPALEYVKELVARRELGQIRFMRGRFMGFRFKERDAGILATTAIHFIYVANHLLGKTPQAVHAKVDYLLDSELDDSTWLRLDYGPEFCVIESDYFTPGKWRTFDIIGTNSSVILDLLDQKVAVHQKKHVRTGGRFEAIDGTVLNPYIPFQEPLYLELRHFLDCIRTRAQPHTALDEGVTIMKIVHAAYESARTDSTVTIRY